MQQFCQYGSVRGATGNRRPYRDNAYPSPIANLAHFHATLSMDQISSK